MFQKMAVGGGHSYRIHYIAIHANSLFEVYKMLRKPGGYFVKNSLLFMQIYIYLSIKSPFLVPKYFGGLNNTIPRSKIFPLKMLKKMRDSLYTI